MLKGFNISQQNSFLSSTQLKKLIKLPVHLTKLAFGMLSGFTLVALLLLTMSTGQKVQSAPLPQSLALVTTGTLTVTHSASTTHQMRVFGNGRITDYYLNDNDRNQIDQDGNNPDATTIAVLFNEHVGTTVDVGFDNDFIATPITLNDPSNIVPYSEDSYVVYASKTLSYQITQRTLTTDTTDGDWIKMRLTIRNTGDDDFKNGRLLFMMDMDIARLDVGDTGGYNDSLKLVYQTDFDSGIGYAMGISLLENDLLAGYSVKGQYPKTDVEKITEMLSPSNSIQDSQNNVSWLVTNIPTLGPGEETTVSFGLCAKTDGSELDAFNKLIKCIIDLRSIDDPSILNITKDGPDTANVGETVTYTFRVSHSETSDGSPIHNISVTDDLAGPATYVSGDTNNNDRLNKPETWIYTASYTIKNDDNNLLANIGTVTGLDTNNDVITGSAAHSADIKFNPALKVKITGVKVDVGETVNFTVTVTNDNINGDGSLINDVSITTTGNISGGLNLANACKDKILPLYGGQTQVCTFSQAIQSSNLESFVITGTATGQDRDGETLNDSDVYTYRPPRRIYLPVVLKDFTPPSSCITYYKDDFDNSSSGWITGIYTEADYMYVPSSLPAEYNIYSKQDTNIRSLAPFGYFSNPYTVEVDARWADTNLGDEYGITFGIRNESDKRVVNLDASFYQFIINTSGKPEFLLRRYDANGWFDFFAWQPGNNGFIDPDTNVNTLRVRCEGKKVAVYVNNDNSPLWYDTLPASLSSPEPTCYGKVGVTSRPSLKFLYTNARFDKFEVCGQAESALSIQSTNNGGSLNISSPESRPKD